MEKKKKLPTWAIILIIIGGLGFLGALFEESDSKKEEGIKETESKWAEYYKDKDVINVDSNILYEYGEYYSNQLVLTSVQIESISSAAIKARTNNNDGIFFSLVFNFESTNELKHLHKDDYVTIVGTVEGSSIGKTITLNDCHIIELGDKAKEKYDELSLTTDEQIKHANDLKDNAEKAKQEKEQADIDLYKDKCASVDYKDVQRNPNNYKEKYIKATGKVIQVSEGWFNSVTLRVQDSDANTWYVTYTYGDGESKILENDNVTVYGKSTGTTTYTSILGTSITIPSISAVYIVLN